MSSGRATTTPSEAELLELTSARGLAALAVVLFHVDAYCGHALDRWLPLTEIGQLAVDFFFVLSGFVLAHVYGASWKSGRYSHGEFLVRRLARIWPLHVVCLLGVGAIVLAAPAFGSKPPWSMSAGAFLSHLFLVNANGTPPHLSWNHPAWSIGAEWSAYVAFPLYMLACAKLRSGAAKLAAAVALLIGLWAAVRATFGLDLLALNANGGALRIIPSFFAGVAVQQICDGEAGARWSRLYLAAGLCATLLAAGVALGVGAHAVLIWLALPALVCLLALRARLAEPGLMRSRPLVWLGRLSFALYLVHVSVLMVAFSLAKRLFGSDDPAVLLAVGAGSVVVSIGVAALAHRWIEKPAQRFVRTALSPARRPA